MSSQTPLLRSENHKAGINVYVDNNKSCLKENQKNQNTPPSKSTKNILIYLLLIIFTTFEIGAFISSSILPDKIIIHTNNTNIDNNNHTNTNNNIINIDNNNYNNTNNNNTNNNNTNNNNNNNSSNSNNNSNTNNRTDYVNDNSNETQDNSDEEKYMTFIPHSGFHNQRIALENALFVAWFLNRTLIIPPALLGIRIPFDKLEKQTGNLKAKPVNSICGKIIKKSEKQKCEIFHNSYTLYPYDQMLDFTFTRKHIKFINSLDYRSDTIYEISNVTDPSKEVYFTITTKSNDKLYDSEKEPDISNIDGNKFIKLESLQLLKKRTEKLVYFGSLFSSYRIIMELESSIHFFEKLKRSLSPSNPVMLSVVANIVKKLGGVGEYVSIHARGSDGSFKKQINGAFINYVRDVDEEFPQISPYLSSLKGKCPPSYGKSEDNTIKVLYVASDLSKEDESMEVFLDKFPCLKMLSDFKDQLEPYKTFINPVDNKVMHNYLIPFTDLMVGANGFRVFVNEDSTFGKYMERYNSLIFKNRRN